MDEYLPFGNRKKLLMDEFLNENWQWMKNIAKSWIMTIGGKGVCWLILDKLKKSCLKFNIGQTNLQLWIYFDFIGSELDNILM